MGADAEVCCELLDGEQSVHEARRQEERMNDWEPSEAEMLNSALPTTDFDPMACPKCGSTDIIREADERLPIVGTGPFFHTGGILADIRCQDWRCCGCGYDWRAVKTYRESKFEVLNRDLSQIRKKPEK